MAAHGRALFAFLETAASSTSWHGEQHPLDKRVRRLQGRARMQSKAAGQSVQLFGDTRYQARKWSRKRRIVMKAEVLRYPGARPRTIRGFVVTNLPDPPATGLRAATRPVATWRIRVKELSLGLALDRTSCRAAVQQHPQAGGPKRPSNWSGPAPAPASVP